MPEFDPNRNKLGVCLDQIKVIQQEMGISTSRIFTSRDIKDLWNSQAAVSNIPSGFNKIMLPFNTEGPATFYISAAGPNVKVPSHSHDEGAGIRFIASGSIIYKGQELVAGDWMYLPAKVPYDFVVGPKGVVIFYCYQCCCA